MRRLALVLLVAVAIVSGHRDVSASGSIRPIPTVNPLAESVGVGTASVDWDKDPSPPRRDVTIPAGTRLSLRLESDVSSARSRVEDGVRAVVQRPVVVRGVTVVPAGSVVNGVITDARRSGRVKGRARVAMRFNALRVGDTRYSIRTASVARQAPATKGEDAQKIGIGAGAGAIVGAISGGKKGAAIGTGVGAAGGTAAVLATRGKEVSIGRGTVVTTRLVSPLTVHTR
jgi:hypothetical protein